MNSWTLLIASLPIYDLDVDLTITVLLFFDNILFTDPSRSLQV